MEHNNTAKQYYLWTQLDSGVLCDPELFRHLTLQQSVEQMRTPDS